MRALHKGSILSMALALLAVAAAWSTENGVQAQQQTSPPQRIIVRMYQVKPEMVTTFEDLRKNTIIPAMKKGGVPWSWTWASATENPNTRVTVQPFGGYSEFDQTPVGLTSTIQRAMGPDAWQIYLAKLRQTYTSQQAIIKTFREDLSVRSDAGTPPPQVTLRTIQVLPGKGDEFTRVMTSEMLPIVKKSGLKDYWVYASNFGAPQGQFVIVTPLDKYADLERGGPLVRAGVLTAEATAQVNAHVNALISSSEVNILRFIPELSYGMPEDEGRSLKRQA